MSQRTDGRGGPVFNKTGKAQCPVSVEVESPPCPQYRVRDFRSAAEIGLPDVLVVDQFASAA